MAKAAALLVGAVILLAAALPAAAQVVVHEHEWAPGAREFSLEQEHAFLEKHFPELAGDAPQTLADTAVGAYVHLLFVLTIIVSALIFVSALDDAFIDAYYWLSSARRRKRRLAHLEDKAQAEFAIMVPAWQEHDVIAAMIENTVKTLDYDAYRIYCGVYRNDAATAAEVERMVARYPDRVVRVDVPHDGPTCKADCLNHIVRRILREEAHGGRTVAAMVLHDSEDVIHPLELKLFNTLLPDADLVQLPVMSLERAYRDFTAGTYIDDFAEAHGKDMAVREALVGLVPGAGVSTCYSRKAMAALWKDSAGEPFNTASLTEDYDLSFRLRGLGMTERFAHVSVDSSPARPAHVPARTASIIATHEYFPDQFRAAYRQRARWILGIAFQGWRNLGWRGRLLERYFLVRDRKVLIMPLVGALAYLLLANFALVIALGDAALRHMLESTLAVSGVEPLLYLNLAFMCNRALQRMYFVGCYYGPTHAALSVIRAPLNNLINFCASMRAWRLFIAHVLTGKKLAWDKTAHIYPDTIAFAAKALGAFALCSALFLAAPQTSVAAPPLPNRAAALVGEAYKAMERGELERAARLASDASKLAPGHASVLLLQAYILARQERPLEALERIRNVPPADLGAWGLSHRGYLWLGAKNAAAAEADFSEAMKLEGLTPQARAGMAGDLAYLLLERKDDERALHWFRIALEKPDGSANAGLYADAGYTAMRRGENRLAIEWFSKAIDASHAAPDEKKPFDAESHYDMRRAVATLSRRWGVTLFLGHSATQAAAASGLGATAGDQRVLQAGAEVFYMPERFGYRNGRVFQLYANTFQALSASEEDYATGGDSRVAGLGARYKPLADHNLSFALERHLALGDRAGDDDWLLRAAWSAGARTDWQPSADRWITWQVYTEAVYYTKAERLIQPFEARIGYSIKSPRLHGAVLTPYAGIAGEYDRAQSPSTAAGVGPGLNLRYWFGETRYSAFPSHADFSIQYRFRLTEAKRGEGLFGQLTVSF